MTCPDFEKKVYLYLSGELNPEQNNDFKNHLKKCITCEKEFKNVKQIWLALDQLPQEKPNRETKKTILEHAKKNKVKFSYFKKLSVWINEWIVPKKWLWGLSTAAVSCLLILFFLRPFDQKEDNQNTQTPTFEWEDNFSSQAEWINSEIDRMESGQFLTTFTFMEDDQPQFEETLSPMSEDLNWIRDQVENLMRTIYGI